MYYSNVKFKGRHLWMCNVYGLNEDVGHFSKKYVGVG
jgi:hypothetical protein